MYGSDNLNGAVICLFVAYQTFTDVPAFGAGFVNPGGITASADGGNRSVGRGVPTGAGTEVGVGTGIGAGAVAGAGAGDAGMDG